MPELELEEAVLPASSFAAHEESTTAPAIAIAATVPIRLMFTGIPSGMSVQVGPLLVPRIGADPRVTVGTRGDGYDARR
ncbi:hypothetical protein P9139_00795 [Curtobacterium flaccumfaciens]|nr:hypothetical protein P9139_00795 [Curtobacterium flaccumfaciens]